MALTEPYWEALGVSTEEADRIRAKHRAMPDRAVDVRAEGPWLETGQRPGHWYRDNKDRLRPDPDTLPRCELPEDTGPGVYFLYLGDDLVYVGRSRNINRRINYHAWQRLKAFDSVATVSVPEMFTDAVESYYIRKLRPKYNVMGNI